VRMLGKLLGACIRLDEELMTISEFELAEHA
jgi:hypothetical protein